MSENSRPKERNDMGVKHFYVWYKKNAEEAITSTPPNISILAIDLNGLFHLCAQKVFRYGNVSTLLLQRQKTRPQNQNSILFREICRKIERLCHDIRPSQKLVLCVDGVAGLGKMNQQRQRRFKTGLTMDTELFNPSSFSPGTKLMDHLTKYIDWFLRSMMTNNPYWQRLEIIFSNEKVPGEGEHKIMQYIRGKESDTHGSICVYGLDADLIMLGLLVERDNMFIAREAEYGFIEYVSLKIFREKLTSLMRFPGHFQVNDALRDFVLMSCLVGNDFLPNIPTLGILDGAFDLLLETYRRIGTHLTRIVENNKVVFCDDAWRRFLKEVSVFEKEILEKKYNAQQSFFPDPLVLKNLRLMGQKNVLYFERYRQDYHISKLKNIPIQECVNKYFDGMLWVLNYYKYGMPDWWWFYPYFYAPLLVDLVDYSPNYIHNGFVVHQPVDPFLQLIMILPESSKDLLPPELVDVSHHLKPFFPDIIEIDMTGKRKEWEGVVILPVIDLSAFENFYKQRESLLSIVDKKRNIRGKNFLYTFNPMKRQLFSSFYGNIYDCPVFTSIIMF